MSNPETTPEYVGHQPEGCRQCGRGYRDGSGGWWCCGDGEKRRSQSTDGVTSEFKALVDAVIAEGHTCQSVLCRVDARIAATPPGTGRDNLVAFRNQLVEEIQNG